MKSNKVSCCYDPSQGRSPKYPDSDLDSDQSIAALPVPRGLSCLISQPTRISTEVLEATLRPGGIERRNGMSHMLGERYETGFKEGVERARSWAKRIPNNTQLKTK